MLAIQSLFITHYQNTYTLDTNLYTSETHRDSEATAIFCGVKKECSVAEEAVRAGEIALPVVPSQEQQKAFVGGAPDGGGGGGGGDGDRRSAGCLRGGRGGRGLQNGGGGQKVHHHGVEGVDGIHDRPGRVEADEDKAGEGARNQ